MPWSIWGCCNQEHATGDNVLAVLWLLRWTSVTYLEKIPYLSWPEFSLSTVLWSHLHCMCHSNHVYHGQERNREMEAGPECKGAMGLQSQLLAPRSDFRWRLRHQTFMLSRPSDVLDHCPFIKYILFGTSVWSSLQHPNSQAQGYCGSFRPNCLGWLKCSYMFAHRCSPSTCLRDCGEVESLVRTTLGSDGAGWHPSLIPFIAVSLSTFPTGSTAFLSNI